MIKVYPPPPQSIITTNKLICIDGENPFHVISNDRVESAVFAAFYPGEYPYAYGGVARLAGALCFFLTKAHAFQDGNKRTAAISALNFLNAHRIDITYPIATDLKSNTFAKLVEDVACQQGF